MQSKFSSLFFISVLVFIGLFLVLFITNTALYNTLSAEDNLAENLSSLFLFITSIFFLGAVVRSKEEKWRSNKWRTFILIALSGLFFLAAGEEISWGQRIFNIETPDYLSEVNDQNELNFHNIDKKFFDRVLDRATILFVLISAGFILFKKPFPFRIKNPNIFIICAFALTPFFRQKGNLDFYHLLYLPLLALLVFAILKKLKHFYLPLLATLVVSIVIPIIHSKFYHLFPLHNNSANEYRELLFCMCCLAYSYLIMNQIVSKTQVKEL